MGGRLVVVWGPGGGDEGVSMSIAGCYDRGADPGRNSRMLTACCIENPRARCRTAPCTVWGEGAEGDRRGGVGEGEGSGVEGDLKAKNLRRFCSWWAVSQQPRHGIG